MSLATALTASFEFFPPKTPDGEDSLWSALLRLAPLAPTFVSVTYGAGGSTRERTHRTVTRILRETNLTPAAHLTCVGATREEVDAVADEYWTAGVRHIVALRGDSPTGESSYIPHSGGYGWASDLIAGLRRRHAFEIFVAAYPTGHPESPTLDADIENLKRKVDAGASCAITQFFFDNAEFLHFRERASSAGITVPIIPGIMPVTHFGQASRFSEKAGVSIPQEIRTRFENLDEDPRTRELMAITTAADQIRELVREGVENLHFYTLNRADLVYALCHLLDIRPRQEQLATVA